MAGSEKQQGEQGTLLEEQEVRCRLERYGLKEEEAKLFLGEARRYQDSLHPGEQVTEYGKRRVEIEQAVIDFFMGRKPEYWLIAKSEILEKAVTVLAVAARREVERVSDGDGSVLENGEHVMEVAKGEGDRALKIARVIDRHFSLKWGLTGRIVNAFK